MKKYPFALLLTFLLMITTSLHAQTADQKALAQTLREEAAEAEAQQEELVNLQKEAGRAMQLHNGTFFHRVYSDDAIWTSPLGINMDKAAFVNSIQNSDTTYSSFVVSDIRVRMFQQTAVVSCLWSARGTSNGNPFARQSRVISVYVYGQRGWKLVAGQETRLLG